MRSKGAAKCVIIVGKAEDGRKEKILIFGTKSVPKSKAKGQTPSAATRLAFEQSKTTRMR
jgi:hypothetical protein